MESMKIDFDNASRRGLYTLSMLYNLPKPYQARSSSGGKGLHIRRNCKDCSNSCYDCMFYLLYDDRRRVKLNEIRRRSSMSHNLLFDIKNGRSCGDWIKVDNSADVETVLNLFSYYWK